MHSDRTEYRSEDPEPVPHGRAKERRAVRRRWERSALRAIDVDDGSVGVTRG
jgi:hypothetical protein